MEKPIARRCAAIALNPRVAATDAAESIYRIGFDPDGASPKPKQRIKRLTRFIQLLREQNEDLYYKKMPTPDHAALLAAVEELRIARCHISSKEIVRHCEQLLGGNFDPEYYKVRIERKGTHYDNSEKE